ncbi:hypothetical protein CYY_007451 [Polysphondylium violaceum]|uniref:Transmembrane protein n=1 Tax=Polysphondylium violaceum TaxID=133409 RepID=A0A8J4V4W6_9MYCE|nr:hypothetical protein CYY_007451 [Polysphondylium violaceum]
MDCETIRFGSKFSIECYLLIPILAWSLYISISRFKTFKQDENTFLYSIFYILFGVRMVVATVLYVFTGSTNGPYHFFGALDSLIVLVMSIICFLSGLADLYLIEPKGKQTYLMIIVSGVVFCFPIFLVSFYFYIFARLISFFFGYLLPYSFVCGFFLLQYWYLKNHKGDLKPLLWFLPALLLSIISTILMILTYIGFYYCVWFVSSFTLQYLMFAISMFMFSYYISITRSSNNPGYQVLMLFNPSPNSTSKNKIDLLINDISEERQERVENQPREQGQAEREQEGAPAEESDGEDEREDRTLLRERRGRGVRQRENPAEEDGNEMEEFNT